MAAISGDAWNSQKTIRLKISICNSADKYLGCNEIPQTQESYLNLDGLPSFSKPRRLSIKNWERIKDQKGNFLVTNSYENPQEQSWSKHIEKLLSAHGMHYKIPDNASNTGSAFFGRTKDMFIQDALCGITNLDAKLRMYGLIKHKFEREDYLVQIRNTKHRQALSKFRLSNHKLCCKNF